MILPYAGYAKLAAVLIGAAAVAYLGFKFREGLDAIEGLEEARSAAKSAEDALSRERLDHAEAMRKAEADHKAAMEALAADAIGRSLEVAAGQANINKRLKELNDAAKSGDCFYGPLPPSVIDILQERDFKAGESY